MRRQKQMVNAEIERQWQDILDDVNVDLLADVEIFKSELTHAFELNFRESNSEKKVSTIYSSRAITHMFVN